MVPNADGRNNPGAVAAGGRPISPPTNFFRLSKLLPPARRILLTILSLESLKTPHEYTKGGLHRTKLRRTFVHYRLDVFIGRFGVQPDIGLGGRCVRTGRSAADVFMRSGVL